MSLQAEQAAAAAANNAKRSPPGTTHNQSQHSGPPSHAPPSHSIRDSSDHHDVVRDPRLAHHPHSGLYRVIFVYSLDCLLMIFMYM